MSDNEKALTDAYYWLSMYKSGATTEVVAIEKVKEVIFDKHNLNENQQIAINNSKKTFEKGADLYDCAIDMVLYDGLTDKEWAEATLAFLSWALEQEEE
ncbi:hypothetical protein [uncultured Enterococcus sp.]|uniref:hypothetical protein n=1 Tax=uncultured Enterococcus sp. TaxID=167972 RepID=UPI0025960670|nr:hypothetical protein [uncultured Enterococcus sp.]